MKNANNNAKATNNNANNVKNASNKITMDASQYKIFIGAYQGSTQFEKKDLNTHIQIVLNNVSTANNPNAIKLLAYPFSNKFAKDILRNETLTAQIRTTKKGNYSLYYTLQFIMKQYKDSIVKEGVKAVNDKIAKDTKGVTETIKTKKTK